LLAVAVLAGAGTRPAAAAPAAAKRAGKPSGKGAAPADDPVSKAVRAEDARHDKIVARITTELQTAEHDWLAGIIDHATYSKRARRLSLELQDEINRWDKARAEAATKAESAAKADRFSGGSRRPGSSGSSSVGGDLN